MALSLVLEGETRYGKACGRKETKQAWEKRALADTVQSRNIISRKIIEFHSISSQTHTRGDTYLLDSHHTQATCVYSS